MGLPSYQVSIINSITGRVEKIYDPESFYSLQYTRMLNDVGIFVMVLPYVRETYDLFGYDYFAEIRRTDPNDTHQLLLEDTYLIRSKHRFRDGNEERVVMGGFSLNHLLIRRIIDPDDDPAASEGYSKKQGAADTVMRAYVREQAADLASAERSFPLFSVDAVAGTGIDISESFRYDNLLEAMQKMAVESGIDFRIYRVAFNQTALAIAPIGSDLTQTTNEPQGLPYVGLSPLHGNISDPSLRLDRSDEKNYVYVLGQGQGEERIVLQASTSDVDLTPYNRIEFTRDSRNVDKTDILGLASDADAALNDNKAVREFTFTSTGVDGGSIYRLNWDVGDRITTSWDDETADLRISGVDINIDSGGETINPIIEETYNV